MTDEPHWLQERPGPLKRRITRLLARAWPEDEVDRKLAAMTPQAIANGNGHLIEQAQYALDKETAAAVLDRAFLLSNLGVGCIVTIHRPRARRAGGTTGDRSALDPDDARSRRLARNARARTGPGNRTVCTAPRNRNRYRAGLADAHKRSRDSVRKSTNANAVAGLSDTGDTHLDDAASTPQPPRPRQHRAHLHRSFTNGVEQLGTAARRIEKATCGMTPATGRARSSGRAGADPRDRSSTT